MNQHDQNNADQVVLAMRETITVLNARVEELEAAATCGCGDMFNTNHQGTCPNCLTVHDLKCYRYQDALELIACPELPRTNGDSDEEIAFAALLKP